MSPASKEGRDVPRTVAERDTHRLQVKRLGLSDYVPVWRGMQDFTGARTAMTPDQIWLLEHPPVFTLGLAGRPEHLLRPGDIPVVRTDRGGQVTYHGPGQLVVYLLLDLRHRRIGVRQLVTHLERAVIGLLDQYGIGAAARPEAPGVYVDGRKISAVGLRIRRGCSYHGLSLNVGMDLSPFSLIDPCGYPGLAVTQLADLGGPTDLDQVGDQLLVQLKRQLG